MLPDQTPVPEADIVLLESTYGDRLHEPDDDGARLAAIVNDSAKRGGKLIIPKFAIGRVEEVLYWPVPGTRRVSAFATTCLTTVASAQQSADLVASHQPSEAVAGAHRCAPRARRTLVM